MFSTSSNDSIWTSKMRTTASGSCSALPDKGANIHDRTFASHLIGNRAYRCSTVVALQPKLGLLPIGPGRNDSDNFGHHVIARAVLIWQTSLIFSSGLSVQERSLESGRSSFAKRQTIPALS